MKHTNKYKVMYYFTDFSGAVKTSYIDRYLQETANSSLKQLGLFPDFMKERNLAFILSKISFNFYEVLKQDDEITVETWALPAKTATFPRNYRIIRNGETIVESVSSWVLLSTTEKKILKPSELELAPEFFFDEDLPFEVPKRINHAGELNHAATHKVTYSDLDENMHMNNTRYLDLICDCVGNISNCVGAHNCAVTDSELPFRNCRVSSLDVIHNAEAKFNDEIDIFISDNLSSVSETAEFNIKAKIKNADKSCFDAKIKLKNNV